MEELQPQLDSIFSLRTAFSPPWFRRDPTGRRYKTPCFRYWGLIAKRSSRLTKKWLNVRIACSRLRKLLRTMQGYEAMQMIRKGQVRWLSGSDVVGQVLFVNETLGVPAA